MKRKLWKKRRPPRPGAWGMEVAGALSIASQMALLYPPGCDEWVRRELGCENATSAGRDRRP